MYLLSDVLYQRTQHNHSNCRNINLVYCSYDLSEVAKNHLEAKVVISRKPVDAMRSYPMKSILAKSISHKPISSTKFFSSSDTLSRKNPAW